MINASVSTTEQVTAYATLAAVAVALLVSLLPVAWRSLTRPRLRWSVGRGEPHRMVVVNGDYRIDGSELRIRVENVRGRWHRRAAQNVRGRLDAVWANAPQDARPWGNLEFDVTTLRWATRRNDPADQEVTVIPVGTSDYLTFAFFSDQRRELSVPGARQPNRMQLERLASHELAFQAVITADGIEPVTAVFCVRAHADVEAVEPCHRPDLRQTYSLGLHNSVYAAIIGAPANTADDAHQADGLETT